MTEDTGTSRDSQSNTQCGPRFPYFGVARKQGNAFRNEVPDNPPDGWEVFFYQAACGLNLEPLGALCRSALACQRLPDRPLLVVVPVPFLIIEPTEPDSCQTL